MYVTYAFRNIGCDTRHSGTFLNVSDIVSKMRKPSNEFIHMQPDASIYEYVG